MDRFVTTLATLSLMVLAFIASVQAAKVVYAADVGNERAGDFDYGGDFLLSTNPLCSLFCGV